MNMNRFTEMMHNVSGALMLIGQTLISAFFVIIILCLVLFVEIQRVAHGIQLFEQSPNLAYFGAFVLVMMLLTLEFVIHYVESKTGYQQDRKSEFSLRILWQWFRYFVGWSKDWQANLKSPAHEIKNYSRLLTVTILALALGGSMTDALSSVQGNWITGLQTIALESSLLEIVEWSGGLLFALALVIGAQRLTAYVAQRASETLKSNDYGMTDDLPDVHHKSLEFNEAINLQPSTEKSVLAELVKTGREHGHVYICECGYTTTPKDSEVNARRALSMHQKSCEVCNEAELSHE